VVLGQRGVMAVLDLLGGLSCSAFSGQGICG
jgi:hypothetical protein